MVYSLVEVDTKCGIYGRGLYSCGSQCRNGCHYNYTEYSVMVVNRRVDKVYGTRSTQSVVDFKFGEVEVRYRSTIEGTLIPQLYNISIMFLTKNSTFIDACTS